MKLDIKSLMIMALTICCINTAGCISFPKSYNTNAKPIYPPLGSTPLKFYKTINTLQPELQWKDVKSEGQTYDICIWETSSHIQDESWWGVPLKAKKWGRQVCYVQGISENHYTINKPLKPNTCYHWSVRIRKGNKVYKWASFSQGMIFLIAAGAEMHVPYGFITPQK